MSTQRPRSLDRLCREVLPLLLGETRGQRLIERVAEVVETDRWNSFDRFHETTQTLVNRYEEAGAKAEVDAIQTGGRIGSGRWIIQEAADVSAATVDVVEPVRQRLLDYREDPWHVIQWSAATPRGGMHCRLVIVDESEKLERLGPDALVGAVVLTRLDARTMLKKIADRGAAAVITDRPVPNLPEALAWTKFGWGAIPMERATARLVGFVLSQRQGEKLRALAQKHGQLVLHIWADIRKYVGTHDVVSGLVRGGDDPQDEVWAIAHSGEPGALDNASGVALTLEIARILEGLVAAGKLRRPRRTIRLLNAYECYGFFAYLERRKRLQTPLAGVCIDTVGARPEVCDGRLEWHNTIPMSAGFVDRVGETVLRSALRRHKPGYRLCLEPFVSTSDTLIGDPKYGFPCPWITTHHRKSGRGFDAYHSSGDTLALVSGKGLETCAAAMAAYLYFLADADSAQVVEVARWETQRYLGELGHKGQKLPGAQVRYLVDAHGQTLSHLERWMWGGQRREIMGALRDCADQVRRAGEKAQKKERSQRRLPPAARQVPRRTALLSPTTENIAEPLAHRISPGGLPPWTLFWADGRRSIAEIAERAAWEETGSLGTGGSPRQRGEVPLQKFVDFFEAHAELGYVELVEPRQMVRKGQLVADLKKLGVEKGMDLMVHSSLSAIGFVEGGAGAVVEALLEAIGKRGTLMMPSFNHRAARVFNPLATPTTNGAIPDAMWRRAEAVRSLHPTHALAAIGPKAEALCSEHLEVGIWDAQSPIGKLIHGGGYILALGTTHVSSTAYHVAELSIPCGCIDSFANRDRVVLADGSVQEVRGLAFRASECPVSPAKLDAALDRRRLQRRGQVGKARAALVRALDLWQVRREHIQSVCPTCQVRPRIVG